MGISAQRERSKMRITLLQIVVFIVVMVVLGLVGSSEVAMYR